MSPLGTQKLVQQQNELARLRAAIDTAKAAGAAQATEEAEEEVEAESDEDAEEARAMQVLGPPPLSVLPSPHPRVGSCRS